MKNAICAFPSVTKDATDGDTPIRFVVVLEHDGEKVRVRMSIAEVNRLVEDLLEVLEVK